MTVAERAPATPVAPPPAEAPSGPPRKTLMKGNEAMAEAAIAAGCDAYFGYPITPQAELLERMALRMPELARVFVQAESELGAINMGLGAAATGARVLVSSSSPGISLMAEGMSYLAGSELPLVLINVMRGGPGLGSIAPSQSDYFQATKGHGHGDYRVPVLAPSTIDEAVAFIADAFEIAERYRTPVMLLLDGVLGQAMEPVSPVWRMPPRIANDWELRGAAGRAPRVVRSLHLRPEDLEAHNVRLQAKFAAIAEREVRWVGESLDDAEIAVVAYGTAARVAQTAIDRARAAGLAVGLLRPTTLWPFPSQAIAEIAPRLQAIVVVELSAGQMVEDVRLAVEGRTPVFFHGRTGGMVPMPGEVLQAIGRAWAMTATRPTRPGAHPTPANSWPAEPIAPAGAARIEPDIDAASTADEADPLSLIELAAWSALEGQLPEPAPEPDPFRLLFPDDERTGE